MSHSALPIDTAALESMIREMQQLLATDDTEAGDLVVQLEPLLSGTEYSAQLQKVVKATRLFDFERAAFELMLLMESLDLDW